MEIEIVIIGVKQYFEIIDGVKTFVRDEHVEINTSTNDPAEVLTQFEIIEELKNNN